MRVELQSTTNIGTINGVPARLWEGQTDSGIAVHAWITRIGVEVDQDQSQFERELEQHAMPTPEVDAAYPMRMVL